MLNPGVFHQAACLRFKFAIDHDAARNNAERTFKNTHMYICNKVLDIRVLEQRADKGNQNHIIGAHKFNHHLDLAAVHSRCKPVSPINTLSSPRAISPLEMRENLFYGIKKRETLIVGVVLSLEEGKKQAAGIKPLMELTAADMSRVNELILSKAGSDVEMIPEVANHLISSGGKRLRPMLTLAAAQMLGYHGDGHIKLATSVEFMHTATLLHDDVVDESDMRRGKRTARMIWGNQASVLVGDFLLGQAFRMMVEVGSLEALDVLSSAASVIAEGEVMQLAAAKNLETTEDEYLAVIKAKTAALFSAAAEVGPIIAKSSKNERNALRSYGLNLGLAFQLVDDALDYGGNARDLGKNVGDDFREGKVTLPVILAYRRGTDSERAFWRECIEGGAATDENLETALNYLRKHGTINDTIQRARHFGEIARDALAPLPFTPQKDALLDVIDFCIARVS